MKNLKWLQVVIPISVGAASCGVDATRNEDRKSAESSEKFSSEENEIISLAATNKPSVTVSPTFSPNGKTTQSPVCSCSSFGA